jgi:hypothetical protein
MSTRKNRRVRRSCASRFLGVAAVVLLASGIAQAQEEGTTPVSGRQPTISADGQFTTTGVGALQERAPGIYVQQGIAVQQGDTSFFTGVSEEAPNFFRETFDIIAMDLMTLISDMLSGLNFLITSILQPGGATQAQPAFIPISNAATTGQGSTIPIP